MDKRTYRGFFDFVDFVDAERALKERLIELDNPRIDQTTLDYMHFTLELCQRILPENTDPIHYGRLDALGTTIFFMLD
jgi:hypothetical protein